MALSHGKNPLVLVAPTFPISDVAIDGSPSTFAALSFPTFGARAGSPRTAAAFERPSFLEEELRDRDGWEEGGGEEEATAEAEGVTGLEGEAAVGELGTRVKVVWRMILGDGGRR